MISNNFKLDYDVSHTYVNMSDTRLGEVLMTNVISNLKNYFSAENIGNYVYVEGMAKPQDYDSIPSVVVKLEGMVIKSIYEIDKTIFTTRKIKCVSNGSVRGVVYSLEPGELRTTLTGNWKNLGTLSAPLVQTLVAALRPHAVPDIAMVPCELFTGGECSAGDFTTPVEYTFKF
jgi:hypothetical protein